MVDPITDINGMPGVAFPKCAFLLPQGDVAPKKVAQRQPEALMKKIGQQVPFE